MSFQTNILQHSVKINRRDGCSTYVYAGHLVGGGGVDDHRVVEGFRQNVFHVLANGRLTGSEFDKHVEGMDVCNRARQMKKALHARHGRVV